MRTSRYRHTATLLPGGQVLVTAGHAPGPCSPGIASAEFYDPATDAWTPAGDLAEPRGAHTVTLLNNGKVLIARGSPGCAESSGMQCSEHHAYSRDLWPHRNYQASRRLTWISRAVAPPNVDPILPKFASPLACPGGANTGTFGRFMTSVRNVSPKRSVN